MDSADFNLGDWDFLPPLDDADLPSAPPPERNSAGGISIGSELGAVSYPALDGSATDLGRAVCEDWATAAPGLAEVVRLGSIEIPALTASESLDGVLACEKLLSWVEVQKQRLLAHIVSRDPSEKQWCIDEVGAALRLSGQVARAKLASAEQLVNRLPETLEALSEGQLTVAQANTIAEKSFALDDELLPNYQARVLKNAELQSLTDLRRTATRAVHSLDPATVQEKTRRAIEERNVRIAPADYGTAWLIALLPAADAKAIYARLDGAAHQIPRQDGRTMDQLRADALVNGVLNGIGGELPTAQGRQPNINVTVGLGTLVGKDQEPGWLDGYGPISAEYAREIAHDPTGTWRRLVIDPVGGQLLDYGTTKYRPPRHLADFVIDRDGQCTFPYCTHSARNSDLDHIIAYPRGKTSAENLQPLHRRHHNAKTEAGWQARRDELTGEMHWTSPQGRRYTTRPPDRWTLP